MPPNNNKWKITMTNKQTKSGSYYENVQNPSQVDAYIGTSYDVVKEVYNNLEAIRKVESAIDDISVIAKDVTNGDYISDMERIDDQFLAVDQQLVDANTRIDSNATDISNLSTLTTQITNNINVLDNEVSLIDSKVEQSKQDISTVQGDISSISTDIDLLNTRLTNEENKTVVDTTARANAANAQNKADSNETEIATLKSDIENISLETNLSTTTTATEVTINSDTGTDATINPATSSNAGLMTPEQYSKLDGLSNYDDSELSTRVSENESDITNLQDQANSNNSSINQITGNISLIDSRVTNLENAGGTGGGTSYIERQLYDPSNSVGSGVIHKNDPNASRVDITFKDITESVHIEADLLFDCKDLDVFNFIGDTGSVIDIGMDFNNLMNIGVELPYSIIEGEIMTVTILDVSKGIIKAEVKSVYEYDEDKLSVPIGAMIVASKTDEEKLGLLGYRKADVDKEYDSSIYQELSLSYKTEGVLQSLVVDGEMNQSNSSIEIADNIYARTNHNYASTIVAGEVLGDIIIQRGISDNPADKWIFDASAYFDTNGIYPIGVSKISPIDDYWYLHVAGKLSGILNIVTLRYNPTITDFNSFVADIVVTNSVIPETVGVTSATFIHCTDNFFVFYTPNSTTKWTKCGLNSDGTSDGNYTDIPFTYTSDPYEEKSILSNNHVFERGQIINLTTGARTVIKNYDCVEYHATFTRDYNVYLCYRSGSTEFSVYKVNDDSSYDLVYTKPHINLTPIFFGQTGIAINPTSNAIMQNTLGVNMIDNSTEFVAADIAGWNPNADRMYSSVASISRSVRKHHFSNSFLLNDINNTGTTEPTQKITAIIDKSMFTVPGIPDPNSKQSYYVNTGISIADAF